MKATLAQLRADTLLANRCPPAYEGENRNLREALDYAIAWGKKVVGTKSVYDFDIVLEKARKAKGGK